MAAGVFQLYGGTAQPILVKLTTNTVTVIAGSSQFAQIVHLVNFAEIAGATPTITLETYDGTTSFYHLKSFTMTANARTQFDSGIWLNPGQFLRATASAANQIDVTGVASIPNAQDGGS